MLGEVKYFLIRLYFIWKYKANNIKLNKKCKITSMDTWFEGCNYIGERTVFAGEIGYASYIGERCRINAEIGRYCSIAHNVETIQGFHPSHTIVSTAPCFFSTARQAGMTFVEKKLFEENRYPIGCKRDVKIGNDVWVGYGVKILAGVSIGDGAIIAMGAVVTKDVEPYTIVGGVPAKVIKRRFTDDQIKKLLKVKWWTKSPNILQKNIDLFQDISLFENSEMEE